MIARVKRAVEWRFRGVIERLDSLAGRVERLEAHLEQRVDPMLRAILDEEASNRRRLYAARARDDYPLAYEEPRPLVSVTLPTRDRPEALVRSLRSVLAQTHEHLEVLVVGDAAGPEIAAAVAEVGDPRVSYANLTQRIAAHPDPERHWLVASGMARNEAARRARGAWLLHFDDDDTLRPDAIAALLARAREVRAEVVYSGFARHSPEGITEELTTFPPEAYAFGWQGALIHGALAFFERELVAAYLGLPRDAYLPGADARAGVRFEQLGQVTFDDYPSKLWRCGRAGSG